MATNNTHPEELIPRNGNGNGYQAYALPQIIQTSVEEDEENLDLRQLWTVVRHRLRLVVVVAVGVTAAVGLWTVLQKPRYESRFNVLIEPPTSKNQSEEQQLVLGLGETTDFDTQIQVLLSPSVLEPIAEQIARQYPDVSYESLVLGQSPLTVEQLDDTKILQVTYEDEDPQKVEFVLDQVAQGYLAYSLEARQNEISRGIQYVKEQLPQLRQKVDEHQEKLQKFRQKYNFLDPENQATQLSEQLIDLEKRYFDTQVELNEARSLYGILQGQLGLNPEQAIAASYLSESPRYQNLLDQLQEVEVELAKQSAVFLDNSPTIETLEDKRQQLLPLLQQEAQGVLGSKFSENVGNARSLSSPSELRLGLNQKYVETANQLQILQLRQAALGQATTQLKQQINQMPLLARQYTDLQRELTIATERLNRFLASEEDLNLESAKEALPVWNIISSAKEPENPVFPNVPRTLSLGLFGGLLLGLGAAFLAERLDPVFHSSEELKENIKLPILGHIPVQKDLETAEKVVGVALPQLQIGNRKLNFTAANSDDDPSKRYTSSPFLEAFRSLNTNIRLLGTDSRSNCIVVSSSSPSEGKSTVSAHLAKAAADMGQRVLIVDADLRRPQVYQRLGLEHNSPGLSNVLADGLDVEEVIQRVPGRENLFVLTAGEQAPDPPRLLSSNRMQRIMEQLQNSSAYDLIIFDTPPLLGFADGRILAAFTSGVVLVVRMGKTDRSILKQTVEQLKDSHIPVLGVVANGVSRHSHSSSHYYDHYYRYYQER